MNRIESGESTWERSRGFLDEIRCDVHDCEPEQNLICIIPTQLERAVGEPACSVRAMQTAMTLDSGEFTGTPWLISFQALSSFGSFSTIRRMTEVSR
jgi:hypothetical protein